MSGEDTRHPGGDASSFKSGSSAIGEIRASRSSRCRPAPQLHDERKEAALAEFRVMTWNVENLFDVGDEDGPESDAQLKAKFDSLAAVINEQEPHVLGLQEIGSESALARLQTKLTPTMPYRTFAPPDDRGIRVGVLSRRVLHDVTEIRPFPGGLLQIQVGDDPPGPDGPRTMSQMGRAALQVTVRAS